MKFRTKFIDKIKADTGIEVPEDSELVRKNLSWSGKTAGQFAWFFLSSKERLCIGSCEGMRELLKCKKILCVESYGTVELFSS